jgi:ABC-type transport system involved in Fe-S cluster assembly fused permease/ATPase subunit
MGDVTYMTFCSVMILMDLLTYGEGQMSVGNNVPVETHVRHVGGVACFKGVFKSEMRRQKRALRLFLIRAARKCTEVESN